MIQVLEDMLYSSVIEFNSSWERYLPLVELTYNNSYQLSIQMAPFEALYARRCRNPFCWSKLDERRIVGPNLILEIEKKVKLICYRLKAALDR